MRIDKLIAGTAFLVATSLASVASAATTLKLAHQWPQAEDDYVIATAIKFAEEVEQRSDGELEVQFFPAQSLVKARDTHVALKEGVVDLAVYPYIYSAGAIPQMNIVLLPGLWRTHDDVFEFRKTEAWGDIETQAQDFGFKTLAWIQISGGAASGPGPVHSPEDVKGLKVRAAGKFMEHALQQAGASTVSMPSSDTYGALQRGLLDAMWTSSSSFGAYRMYEVAKHYVSPTDYSIYFTIEPITVSMKTWNDLSPEQQQILVEAGKSVEQMALEGAKAEDARVAKVFADNGVSVEKLTAEDWQAWQSLFREHAFEKFKEDVPGGAELLDKAVSAYE